MSDLISRQAIKEWLAKWYGYIDMDIIARMQFAVDDIPTVQTHQDSDCISRQMAIKSLFWDADAMQAIEQLPSAHPEITMKDVGEYCTNRCLIVITTELFHKMRARWSQSEIIKCKDCKHYEQDVMANPWGVCCHPDWRIDNCGSSVVANGWCYRAERKTNE